MHTVKPLPANKRTIWPFQRWISFILPCLFAALCQSLPAASFFVAKTGNDSDLGTQTQPFLTVQKGVNTAKAGDTVLVGAGDYNETVTSARSGSNGSRIILDGQGVATIRSMLFSHQFLSLQNFTVAGKTSGWWAYMAKGAHHCTISNNVFDGGYHTNMFYELTWESPATKTEGPFGNGSVASDCLVISNTFKRASGCTVIQVFGDRNVIYGNRLIDGDAVDWFHAWGRSNYIVANVCSNAFVSGLDNNHPDFFQSFGLNGAGSEHIIIESNLVMNSYGDSQLCMLEGQDNPYLRDFTFRNNLFVNISSKGTMACPDVKWYNNTFYRCGTNSAASPFTLIFASATNATYTNFEYSSGHGGQVYNNAFIECGDGRTDRGWYYFATNLTNVRADYNFVSQNGYNAVDGNPLHQAIGDAGGWNIWKWWEPHGINGGDPKFINLSNFDLRLQDKSPLIGKALPLSQFFTTDRVGTTRGAQWDIGAFEFQAGETILPPIAPRNPSLSPF